MVKVSWPVRILLAVALLYPSVTHAFCAHAISSHFATSNSGDVDAALASGGRNYVGDLLGATEKVVFAFSYPSPSNPSTLAGSLWWEGDPGDGATSTSGSAGFELTCGCAPNSVELHNIAVGAATQVSDAALGTETLSNEAAFTGLTCANHAADAPCWVFVGRTNDVTNDVPGNVAVIAACMR